MVTALLPPEMSKPRGDTNIAKKSVLIFFNMDVKQTVTPPRKQSFACSWSQLAIKVNLWRNKRAVTRTLRSWASWRRAARWRWRDDIMNLFLNLTPLAGPLIIAHVRRGAAISETPNIQPMKRSCCCCQLLDSSQSSSSKLRRNAWHGVCQ